MGRDKGTNDYSNNFEPQVTGLLDARTRVDTKADLLLASTWTSSDGNVYLPRGIRVSVTNDSIAANNGVYMLMDEDYSVTSNWLQIGGVEKQDKLVSGKNIKTINGQSLLGSGNITISSSGGSGESGVYLVDSSKLSFHNITEGGLLTQSQYEELSNIASNTLTKLIKVLEFVSSSNVYISSIVSYRVDSDGRNHYLLYGLNGKIYDYSIDYNAGVGKTSWRVVSENSDIIFNIDSTKINFANIKSRADKNATEAEMIYINDYIAAAFLEKKNFNYIDTDEQTGAGCISSVDFSATVSNEDENITYLNFSLLNGDTPEIYRLVMDNVSTTPDANRWEVYTQSVNPDLTIDVKAGSGGIYYRIKEVVPNGYIQFVRKKKKKYYSMPAGKHFAQTTYSPMGLSYVNMKSGVDVSTLTPNVWYKFPITDEELVNTYTAGSVNPEGHTVSYNMYKFSGNTHARPILFDTNSGTVASKRTTVLHAGLQYNVLDDSFIGRKSAKLMFKQRGDIHKIDVRLSVEDINKFALGYKLVYAIK